MRRIKSDRIISGGKEISGYVYFDGGKIVEVTDEDLPCEYEYDATGKYVSAGFIDIHTHGGGGYAFEADEESVVKGCNFHLTHGTTSICPTVSASYISDMRRSVESISRASENPELLSHIIGAHLEGPYLSPVQTGAQGAEFITPPVKEDYESFISDFGGAIVRWSYAPENDTDNEFLNCLRANGIVASAGHTNAVYSDMKRALLSGCNLVTHLYSCTSTVTRSFGFRSLGVIESAFLEDDMYVEIIADGKHLPLELIRMIYKIKGSDRIALVTDSLSLAGTDVKTGRMQSTDFIIEDGVCKLLDRSAFAGSVATADRLVRVLSKEVGISLVEAVKMITKTPAKIMGLDGRGDLLCGMDADIVVFDGDVNVQSVFVDGELVFEKTV